MPQHIFEMSDKFIGKWVFPLDDSLLEHSGRRGEHYKSEIIAADIVEKMHFRHEDIVLDICCGNGILTTFIAKSCKEIHGVDHSEILIRSAQKLKTEEKVSNFRLHLQDVFQIEKKFGKNYFDKSYCYFSFQYFNKKKRTDLLKQLSHVTKKDGLIFLGDMPDADRMKNYYKSPQKFYREKISRFIKLKEGECFLGWWIHPQEILDWCTKNNLSASILPQVNLPHAHYRFDVLIRNSKK